MQPLNTIIPQLDKPHNVVITTHQKPDADAMGSSLGLYHFLTRFGHQVTVIFAYQLGRFPNWMPGCKKYWTTNRSGTKANAAIEAVDWLFCLDFNVLSRTKLDGIQTAQARANAS